MLVGVGGQNICEEMGAMLGVLIRRMMKLG